MSSNYSIELDILRDVQTAIRAITTANGWPIEIDSDAVWLDEPQPLNPAAFKYSVEIVPDESTPEDYTDAQTRNSVGFIAIIRITDSGTARLDWYKATACVRDAIMVNKGKRSGLCSFTRINRTVYYQQPEQDGVSYISEVICESFTHHSITNYRGQ